ncbi:hypothetical protein [Paenibacillus mucilaginosus]|uniref:hypothetical protein n=1 Tax=Paenibacillus mucilaginosus TaxID=61624 RepID=UPI00240D7613|nr:hypothetical protein [Paenibacillus mucilaginosus]
MKSSSRITSMRPASASPGSAGQTPGPLRLAVTSRTDGGSCGSSVPHSQRSASPAASYASTASSTGTLAAAADSFSRHKEP